MTTLGTGIGPSVFRFADFELDPRTLELHQSGEKIKLAPQPAQVLRLLASRPGELVSRDEIRHEIWGDDTFVDFDRNLNYCLTCIRNALGDTAQAPRFIETLPRRGYRFIAAVERPRPFSEPTLAVLPFANLNADPARDFFADGITDVLITELARIKSLRVISRQSVLHLKGSHRKVDEIAADLGVDGVVEGTVLHDSDRVRITAQLVLTRPERHVWAESFDCDMSAVLATQRDAARDIAASVAFALTPNRVVAARSLSPRPPRVPASVVETHLKGVAALSQASAEGLQVALQCFREVSERAPDFAPALAGHAVSLFCLGWFAQAPATEVFPAARQLALRAVAIDDSASGPHNALGIMHWFFDGDLASAEAEFQRAIELSPSDADAHTLYGLFLSGTGRYAESFEEVHYGWRLNPTALIQNQALAWVYLHAGDCQRARFQARRTLDLFPGALQPQFVLGWAAWREGSADEAVAAFEASLRLSREALSLCFLGHVFARLGRTEEALAFLREIDDLFRNGRASPIAFVIIHAGLGNLDAAFEWLDRAYGVRSDLVWITKGFPGLDPLRPDPRFAAFLRRLGPTSTE